MFDNGAKLNTDDIMNMALSLCGMFSIPADSEIFWPVDNVERILLGIDIGEGDIIRASKDRYDLVIAHHPLDQTGFISLMPRHEELMIESGVSPSDAANASQENMKPYERWTASLPIDDTTNKLTTLAADLCIGLMNIHNPCDEIGRKLLQKPVNKLGESRTIEELIAAYRAIPEMSASKENVELICGSIDAPIGKAAVIHAAGTNGGFPVADALFKSGIDTVIYIHVHSKKARERLAKEGKGNLIITGHYCSDSLGINPLIDVLENKGIVVDCCNEMIRIKR